LGTADLLATAAVPIALLFVACGIALVLYELVSGWRTRRTSAERRAATLLTQWLTPTQRAQYETQGHFTVTGCHTGRHYLIRHGRQANIIELDARGGRLSSWCFGPEGELPTGDILLAQKIALETDELGAIAIANRSQHVFY